MNDFFKTLTMIYKFLKWTILIIFGVKRILCLKIKYNYDECVDLYDWNANLIKKNESLNSDIVKRRHYK